ELQPGQVTDLRGGQLGVVAEVELLQGGAGREPGGPDPPGDLGGVAAGQLVLAQHLEELGVPEGAGPGLGQPRVQGVEHAGQAQRLQHGGEPCWAPGGPRCSPPNAPGPRSQAGTPAPGSGSWTPSCSVPAARMPLTVREDGSAGSRARAQAASSRPSP